MKLLPAIASGVLTHVLFHHFHPVSSVSVLLLISSALLCLFSYTLLGNVSGVHSVVIHSAVYLASLFLSITVYRLSPFHPLARYPGPAIAKLTKLWGLWNSWTGQQHHVLHRLHQKYGPFVRTGPNEISVADVQAVSDVLGAGGIPKGEYYTVRQNPKIPSPLLMLTGEEHAKRRRLWNRGMSTDSLKAYETLIAARSRKLVDRLKTESRAGTGSAAVNIVRWIEYFAFDFVGDLSFGGSFHMLVEGEDKHGYWDLLNRYAHSTSVMAHLPWAVNVSLKIPFLSRDVQAFRKLCGGAAAAKLKAGTNVKDLWYHLSDEAELEKTRPPVGNVIADSALAMIAGADTTASALAIFLYYILKNSECYKKLRAEIDQVYPPGSDATDTLQHDRLVWLNACLNESFRLFPASPTNGPRQVPYTSKGATVAGRFVPPGTQIYVPPYAIHRDPRYFFPSPDKFLPSRWLNPSVSGDQSPAVEGTVLNRSAFIAFSYGPANCVGQNLARMEMRMVISMLIQNFDLAFADGVDQEQWLDTLQDHVIVSREPLWLKLTERAAGQ